MRNSGFGIGGLVLAGVVAVNFSMVKADYESNGYILDGVGWQSVPAAGNSNNYAISGSTGSSDSFILPTPPAPTVSVVPTAFGTLHVTVKIGDNDPHVLVQLRLIDDSQTIKYYTADGIIADGTSWSTYTAWGSSIGRDISGLSPVGYRAQVRVRAEDFSISEWSAESAAVIPLSSVTDSDGTPTIAGVSLPSSVDGLISSVQKKIRESGVSDAAKIIATALVPLTAIAALAQIATIGGFIFQIIFGLANRFFSALLSGLQFLAFYRKKRVFGVVYDGKTHRPLTGATVELLRPDTRRLLDSQTTNQKGQYYFLENINTSYLLRIQHPRFETFERIVRGRVNIPVYLGLRLEYDPAMLRRQANRSVLLEQMNTVRLWLLLIGTVAWGILFFGDYQSWVGYAIGTYYVLAWSLELYVRRQPRPYGLVVNAASRGVLPLAVVRILDAKDKLVSTLVCDEQGRFKTWLQPGVYRFSFSKAHFKPAVIKEAHISRSLKSMEVTAELQPV